MIAKEVIDDIRLAVDIVDLVSEVIHLRRSGTSNVGLCPFHDEKTPSFSVNGQKQLYYCFGCGEGGTVIQFVMKYYGLSFPEALEKLADRAGIELKPESPAQQKIYEEKKRQKKNLYDILYYAAECFHLSLLKSPLAKEARQYLKKRKLSDDIIRKWQIGYAPQGVDKLLGALNKKGFSDALAKEAGLAREYKGCAQDYFRHRIVFPIKDSEGQVVGFGARRILEEEQPKYLNSPENPVFHKSEALFGIDQVQRERREHQQLILVEGYTDVIALHEAGFSQTVACLGTSFNQQHAKAIKKHAGSVLLLFDGDQAGRKAAFRAMPFLLQAGLDTQIVSLPLESDPDGYLATEGKKALSGLIRDAQPALDFFLRERYTQCNTLSKKTEFIQQMATMVRGTRDVFVREALLDQVCRLTSIKREALFSKKQSIEEHNTRENLSIRADKAKLDSVCLSESEVSDEELILIRLCLENPSCLEGDYEKLPPLFSDTGRELLSLLNEEKGEKTEKTGGFPILDRVEGVDLKSRMTRIFMDDSLNVGEDGRRIFTDCLKKLKKRKIKNLSFALAQAEKQGDQSRVQDIFKRISILRKDNSQAFGVDYERR